MSDLNATKGDAFTRTLNVSDWNNKELVLSDSKFVASGFAYIVNPDSTNAKAYANAGIVARNVTVDGYMTFVCETTPTSSLIVNILKVVTV